MTWEQGTDAPDALRKALKAFIETWLANDALQKSFAACESQGVFTRREAGRPTQNHHCHCRL